MPYTDCKGCGKTYYVKPYRAGKTKFCSYSCAKQGVVKKCEACGSEFYVPKARASKARFCSSKCWTNTPEAKAMARDNISKVSMSGENNPRWMGGITPQSKKRLTGAIWRKLAAIAKELDGSQCTICGGIDRLQTHHKVSWRNGGDDLIYNLTTLCKSCHHSVEIDSDPLEAIKSYCKNCQGNDCSQCQLHPFRFGKNPFRTKRELTDEQKKAAAVRLANARTAKIA